jgi:hydroxymethylpyrimidine pyrophosphatase-like HAD family hydrolase
MLKRLINLKGYQTKDVIVFGDQFNDIGMFKLAGTSCAMSNAPIEVQKEASIVIQSNKKGGVIRYLEENFDNLI